MKTYGLMFGTDDPRTAPQMSLAPTLIIFAAIDGTVVSTPGVTKPISTVGLYTFNYTPSLPVFFLADGGALITDNNKRYVSGILDPLHEVNTQVGELSSTLTARHQTLFSIGTTNVALGTTNVALGTTNVALGTTIQAQATSLSAQSTSIFALNTTIASIVSSLTSAATNISGILAVLGTTASSIGTTTSNPGDIFGQLKRLQEFNEGAQTFNKTTGIWSISSRGGSLIATKTLTNTSTQVNRS